MLTNYGVWEWYCSDDYLQVLILSKLKVISWSWTQYVNNYIRKYGSPKLPNVIYVQHLWNTAGFIDLQYEIVNSSIFMLRYQWTYGLRHASLKWSYSHYIHTWLSICNSGSDQYAKGEVKYTLPTLK